MPDYAIGPLQQCGAVGHQDAGDRQTTGSSRAGEADGCPGLSRRASRRDAVCVGCARRMRPAAVRGGGRQRAARPQAQVNTCSTRLAPGLDRSQPSLQPLQAEGRAWQPVTGASVQGGEAGTVRWEEAAAGRLTDAGTSRRFRRLELRQGPPRQTREGGRVEDERPIAIRATTSLGRPAMNFLPPLATIDVAPAIAVRRLRRARPDARWLIRGGDWRPPLLALRGWRRVGGQPAAS